MLKGGEFNSLKSGLCNFAQSFAEHLTAEYRVKTEGLGCKVDEWKMRPEAHDKHWFDGVVRNAVAASMCGCVLAGTDTVQAHKPAKPKVKLSKQRKRGM